MFYNLQLYHSLLYISFIIFFFCAETNTCVKLSHNKKNVRRNLNFTKIPTVKITPVDKTETIITTSRNNLIDNSREENSHLSTRKSFLMPPNTVKNLYIKDRFRQNKSILPQSHVSTYSVCDNKNHKISKRLESCSSPVKVTNMQIDSVIHEEGNKTMIQRISSQMCTVNDQSGIDILCTNYTDIKDDAMGKENPESSINIEEKKCLSMSTDNCRKNLRQSIQNVQMINQSCLDLNHTTNKNNEYIILNTNCTDVKDNALEKEIPESLIDVEEKKCLSMNTDNCRKDLHQSTQAIQMINQSCLNLNYSTDKNEYIILNKTNLIDLASKLKHNIYKLEEDTLPNLRFILSTIMDVLSAINITNKESDNNNMQQMIENLEDDIKITNNINTKSLCVSSNIKTEGNTEENNIEKSIIEDSNIPKEIYKTPDNLMKLVKTDVYEKNNSGIRSSHQIDFQNLTFENNKENDSFEDLENKLDITNIKSSTTIVSLKKSVPVNKYNNKKEEKPLKEYMALKSRMSCLLTPNIKHFNCLQSKNNIHSESGDAKASISGKILAELYHLYED